MKKFRCSECSEPCTMTTEAEEASTPDYCPYDGCATGSLWREVKQFFPHKEQTT